MDTLERAAELADNLEGYVPKDTQNAVGVPQLPQVSPSPYGGHPLPSTMTQSPDSQRQFYKQGGAGQYRFFNSIPEAANKSSAPSQNQAQRYAKWQASTLTLSAIADSPTFAKVPIEQFDANGNLILANFQGAWDSTITYSAGQEVSYTGNVWVATDANTDSIPAVGNAFWQLVGPQTLDNVADGSSYGKVSLDAIGPAGEIDFAGTAWVNKTLDHLPDGSAYARVLGNLTYGGTLRTPHASTIAQLSPSHWYPAEGLGGGFPVTDIGTSPTNLTLVSLGGAAGISGYSLVNGDALKGAFLGNYAAYYSNPAYYGGNFTFATWAYFNGANPPTYASLMSMSTGAPTSAPGVAEGGLYVDTGGRVTYSGSFTGGLVFLQTGVLNWAVPHHIVLVVNGSSATIVVDGVVSATGSASGTHDAFQYVVFGANWNGSAWQGSQNTTFQHIAMWDNAVFSLGQIIALYQAGAAGAQSLDNVADGGSWQRVTGVSGNKTTSGSYTQGSVTNSYTAQGPVNVSAPAGTETTIASVTLAASAQNQVIISGFSQFLIEVAQYSFESIAFRIYVGGTQIAEYQTTWSAITNSGSNGFNFTYPATYWAGSLAGQTISLRVYTTNTTLPTTFVYNYITVGNLKA